MPSLSAASPAFSFFMVFRATIGAVRGTARISLEGRDR